MDCDVEYRINRFGRRIRTFVVIPDADVSEPEIDSDADDCPHESESDNDDSSNDTGDPAVATSSGSLQGRLSTNSKNDYTWNSARAPLVDVPFTAEGSDENRETVLRQPIEYFKTYFILGLFSFISKQTNLYAQQQNQSFETSPEEIEVYVGILIKMGVVNLPRYRLFWSDEFRFPGVADRMSRDRFFLLNKFIHFADNNDIVMDRNSDEFDRLFKVRTLLEFIRRSCLKLEPLQHQSVDEQIIPFKGKTSLKQYLPKKPHRWGFKVISRNGVDGFTHDFYFYDGSPLKLRSSSCGYQPGDMVLKVCEMLPRHANHIVYFDNFFNFIELQIMLKRDFGIESAGTLRANRLRGCPLKSEKELQTTGRGSFDCRQEKKTNISIVRWFDNRSIQLSSSYVSVNPITNVQRFDRKAKKRVQVPCPAIVTHYNQHMGGVDKFDMLMSLYRCDHKTRKFYKPIFFWSINLCLVNAWIHYKRDCDQLDVAARGRLDLLSFSAKVSNSLCLQGKTPEMLSTPRKRGRPCRVGDGAISPAKTRRRSAIIPQTDIRSDQVAHWPEMVTADQRQRCKVCHTLTQTRCEKCTIFLCIRPNRNCYKLFHNM